MYNFTALVQIAGTSTLAILGLRKYHQRLCEFYSDVDDKSIYTNKKVLHWFLFTIPLSLALIIPDIKFWEEHRIYSSFVFIAWAVVYYALFYYGSQKRHTIDNFILDLQQADLEEKIYCETISQESESFKEGSKEMSERQISPEVYQRLQKLFKKLIDEEKVYLKSDLRLDEVARLMFTNRAYVSKLIKDEYHCSFSDYINDKRINFSMELMRLEPHLTQDKIALLSGFLNAQSYSRTFKKKIGMPPQRMVKPEYRSFIIRYLIKN